MWTDTYMSNTANFIHKYQRTPHRIVDRRELMDRIARRRRENIKFWIKEGIQAVVCRPHDKRR